MKYYLDQAQFFISPKITGIIRRNRVIARATNLYISDSANFNKLYSWVEPDIITTEDRARHYGVPIGTQIGFIKSPKDAAFFSKVAGIKRQFRTMSLNNGYLIK